MDQEILEILKEIKSAQKKQTEKIITAIKKNRTTIEKKAFDKSMINPMIESNAEMRRIIGEKLDNMHIGLTNTINVLADKIVEKIKNGLQSLLNIFKQ